MKYIKNFFKLIGFIFLTIIAILLADYGRLNISYYMHKSSYEDVFLANGTDEDLVPQGLVYSSKYNVVLQTSYGGVERNSMLYVIDFGTGKLLKELKLMDLEGNYSNKHVGGLTTDENIVYITNDYEIDEYSLDEIVNTENDYIQTLKNDKLPNRGDFCLYNDGYLWIGEFHTKLYYSIPSGNPLLMGYELNKNLDYNSPKYVISLPKMVQGMEILPNGNWLFSRSFTNLIYSNLSIYKDVTKEETSLKFEINGKEFPYYVLSKDNLVEELKIPPMSEGIFYKDKYLYIVFESNADKYFFAYPKVKNVIKYYLDY